MWTRCCFTCWPKGYKNTCEESWGQWFRIGVRTLRGLQETLRVRERRRAGWPPPGERCSGSTSSERTGDVSPAAGDAAGRRVVPRVSAPRGAQGELCPGAGCRSGGPRSCARCGRSRWRTSSAACRVGGLSRFRALRRFPAASAGPGAVSGVPRGLGGLESFRSRLADVRRRLRCGGPRASRLRFTAPRRESVTLGLLSRPCATTCCLPRGLVCPRGLEVPWCPGWSGCPPGRGASSALGGGSWLYSRVSRCGGVPSRATGVERTDQMTMPRAASQGRGSIFLVPFCHTSKCRCGPVLWPRLPISAICWPHLTFCPSLTEKLFMWP